MGKKRPFSDCTCYYAPKITANHHKTDLATVQCVYATLSLPSPQILTAFVPLRARRGKKAADIDQDLGI